MKMPESETAQESGFRIDKEDKTEGLYRIYSVVTYIFILIIIGLPMWWFTTRVYRAPLPLSQMYEVSLAERQQKSYGLPLSLNYDILITIVNPDPEHLNVDLDGELLDINLQPFLETVQPVANFTVKSQWLYLTELEMAPIKVDDYYVYTLNQLPHLITPLEKKLWSHISPHPCINLILYVASCEEPLYIQEHDKSLLQTNTFLSPRWGGITILNADENSCKNGLYKPKLVPIIAIFQELLTQLLQINGQQEADLIAFKQKRTMQMIDSSRGTLKSLAQLLSEISSIVISDDVAEKINVAVEQVEKAEFYVQSGNIEKALVAAKSAFDHSEAAFSDPSLLALLYFPDDQKYAIYIPLFLPVMIPVLMSVTTVRRWYMNWKQNKVKAD